MQQTTDFFKKLEKERRFLSYLTCITAIKWNSHQDCSKVMKENGEMRLCCWCFLTIVHCKSLKGGACKRLKMRVLFVYRCHATFTRYFKSGTFKHMLTEPRWALQPQGTQRFPRIWLFVVQAISLGPCRWPIEFLTSSQPCGRLSKIPNSQIHKVEKWKFLSNFPRKDFFVISHEDKDRFFVVI